MIEPRAIVFADDPDKKPLGYACPKCGSLHTTAVYATSYDLSIKAAKQAATECYTCRTDYTCQDCGQSTGSKHWMVCAACRDKRKIAKRKQVESDTFDYCFSFDEGEFFSTPEEAAEAGCEWVIPASGLRKFSLDADSILENIFDDHFEDASEYDLNGVEEFRAAVKAFNEAQTSGTYDADDDLVCNVKHLQPKEAAEEADGEAEANS